MARQAHKAGRRPEMPFEVNHALWGKVETQVTDGLRMAILSGFYKPGDILPSQIELARALGVSTRAPQTALRVLAEEGLVSPRTKRGTLVLGPRMGTFRGRVVIVQRDNHPDPIDLLARDPERDASAIADAVLSYLGSGTFPSDLTLGTEFVAGATK